MNTTFSEQQLTCLSDFHVTVSTAVHDLTHKMTQEAASIRTAGNSLMCQENIHRLAHYCDHLLHWCQAYGAFSGLELAQVEPDWDALQPADPEKADEERDCAIWDFKQLVAIADAILDEIVWLQRYFNCSDGYIPLRRLTHWRPDRYGIPEVRDETMYELVDLQDRVEGWEKLDPECNALLEQYAITWKRIRSVADATRPPPEKNK